MNMPTTLTSILPMSAMITPPGSKTQGPLGDDHLRAGLCPPDRQGGPASSRNKSRSIRNHLRARRWTTLPNPGGGNCLLHAVAGCLLMEGDERDHRSLRDDMVNLMYRERSTLGPLWDGLAPRAFREAQPCHNFLAYLRILAQPGTWTGELELLALGRLLERPILVLREDRPPLLFGTEPPSPMRRGIAIWHHHEHFEWILETVPPYIWASARAVDPQHPAQDPATLGYTPPHISHRGGAHPTLPRGGGPGYDFYTNMLRLDQTNFKLQCIPIP